MPELLIIGGGPAGLTAAVYAVRRRLEVLLLSPELGGKSRFRPSLPGFEEHRLIRGGELVSRFLEELEYLQFAHRLATVDRLEAFGQGFRAHLAGGQTLEARGVILATGCESAPLGVPGERELFLKGVFGSATSYAPLFLDRTVLVAGDGPLAARSAFELAAFGAKVYLVAVGAAAGEGGLPASWRAAAGGEVTLLEGSRLRAIRGAKSVEEVELEERNGESRILRVDAVFAEREPRPNSGLLAAGLAELDREGFVRVDSRCRTRRPGLFAAGDVTDVHREQILVAVGEGAKACLSAVDYLQGKAEEEG
jgi:alkyl hydroperoxide reductase subunit F